MRARRTARSNTVCQLQGGTEDNDLWVEALSDEGGGIVLSSTWVPTEEERAAIAAGENLELLVWGRSHPPVCVRTTDVELKGTDRDPGRAIDQPIVQAEIAEVLNRLPEVRWDRFTYGAGAAAVYGWIDRADGRADFVLVRFRVDDEGTRFFDWWTSSAKHSLGICERLNGKVLGHVDCERVDERFGHLVERTTTGGDRG